MQTKICARKDCPHNGIPQDVNFFAKDKSQKSGLHPYCRTCRSALASKRMASSEKARENQRQATKRYYNTKRGKENTKAYYIEHKAEYRRRDREYGKKPEVLLKRAEKQADYRKRNGMKEAARRCVNYAIKNGVISRPENCEWCGHPANGEVLQAHHWMGYDFKNWFNVKFVHVICHRECEGISPNDWD